MATQQIEFEAPSGLTLTCTLHSQGSDTVSYTASAVTEQTNRKGVYRATFSNIANGYYQLIARSGSTGVASWWGYAQDIAQTFSFGTSVTRTDGYVSSFISLQIAEDIETYSNNWNIALGVIGGQSAYEVWNSLTSAYTVNGTFGQRVLRSTTSQSTVAVTGSNHVAADIHELQPGVIIDADFAAGSIYEKLGTLIEADPVSGFRYTTQALEQAPSGGGAGDASQATLLQVKAKTDQLTFTTPNKVDSTFYGEVPVVINQPVSGGNQRIDIIRGDTYNDIRKPKLRFTVSKNYAGCTITLTIRHRTNDEILLTKTGAVDSSTILSVELTGTDTAFSTLPLDEYGLHVFDLQATDGSNNRETIILGGSAVLSLDQTR